MLNRQTISQTQAQTLNNSISQNKKGNSIINESNNESAPRNQSYLSQATEQAKNFLFPENEDSKYPYPEEKSIDNLSKNNKINSSTNQNLNINSNQNKSNTYKKNGNYTYGSMVDSVITDEDVEKSEHRIRELAAERRRGSISKSGQTSSTHNKNNTTNNNNEANKGGLMSIFPFSHKKSKSEETNNSNNINKKSYVIPDENQYINPNFNNDNKEINNSKFSNKYNTEQDQKLMNENNTSNRDDIDIRNRSNVYNSNINNNNNIKTNDISDYTNTSRKYDPEIDPNTEIHNDNIQYYKNNDTIDDRNYQHGYDKGNVNNNDERTDISNADIYSPDKDLKLGGNEEYLDKQKANDSNLDSNYDTYDDYTSTNNNNDESLLTKLKNYITGNEKQDESNEFKELNNPTNDIHNSNYNKIKDSSNYDDLIGNNKNIGNNYETSENMGSNLAFVSNPNIYNSKKIVNTKDKQIESDFNSRKPFSNNDQQYQKFSNYDQNKNINTLKNQNHNGLQGADSTKKDVTTDMFTDSEPYRMVQNQEDKAYLKPEYSKGLKINEKRSNLVDKNELDPGFQSTKYAKNSYAPDSGGALNKKGIEKPVLNKISLAESKNVYTGINSKNYDGYYAGTKSKSKDNQTSSFQTPNSYSKNFADDYSRETKIKSENNYDDELNHSNNIINDKTTSNYKISPETMRTDESSNWKSDNTFTNDALNFTNSSYGNQTTYANTHGKSNIEYNNKSNYANTDYNKLSGIKEPVKDYGKESNLVANKNNQINSNNYNSDHAENKQTEIPSKTGGFVKGNNGVYEYTENNTADKYEEGKYNDKGHTKSKEGEHKGLNKIKNLFTSKDKKTKKDVQKTNLGEHGTVYHPTDNRISTKSETISNKNYVNPNSPINKDGGKFRNVDYSTSAANKSYDNYTNTHNDKSNVLNEGIFTETPPGFKENNYGVGQIEHHRKKSLIENIKDVF